MKKAPNIPLMIFIQLVPYALWKEVKLEGLAVTGSATLHAQRAGPWGLSRAVAQKAIAGSWIPILPCHLYCCHTKSDIAQILPQGGATTVKEPFAFKKVRHRKEHTNSHYRLPSAGGDDSVLITPAELDFIPLDQDFGEQQLIHILSQVHRYIPTCLLVNLMAVCMLDNTTHTDWCLLTFSAAPDFIAL